ncbi:hypothetical protein [Streptomyces flavalbus]|uniref:Uncharacterized protein n=1 Tax=Streptomyces flavalbus TaxID=2665155 RepID=A0ABW2WCB7_9ACTN
MNELIRWIARKRFEDEKKRDRQALLLAEGLKARAIRLKAEAG